MKRCLVVDDASVIRKVSRVFLEDYGYEVAEAESAQEALNACKARVPDMILLDWHLPGLSAMEFLNALRVSLSGKRPIIVYCTTENDPADISRAFAAGADDYLLKPFDRDTFMSKLQEVGMAA